MSELLPVLKLIAAWIKTHSWLTAGIPAVLLAIWALFRDFLKQVWNKLQPPLVDATAAKIEHLFTRYPRKYAQHLYYRHRTFDVKGFSTQGPYALELEQIYVDLAVDPALLNPGQQSPISIPKPATTTANPATKSTGDSPDIFAWLLADPHRAHNFAIVGPPGSGKTTLLKHLALTLADAKKSHQHLKLTPVLLFLRDHSAAIAANPQVPLTELIEATLKDVPPPPRWFASRLTSGKCLIMLDGLDEVADPALRAKVVLWVERQRDIHGANRFLLSSRPNGYRQNPIDGFTLLRVLPFTSSQMERFVRNWYLANEIMAHQKNDPGVKQEATRGADDLLNRLQSTPNLQDLAVNPLLLTLIATVHRYRSELPGRRVELFAEICDVFLGKRQLARGLELDLTPAQKIRVLRVLAYDMMCRNAREIKASDAAGLISEPLKLVSPTAEPIAFLKSIEDSSGLLIEHEADEYAFSHLTFQEYLASLHIKEEGLLQTLTANVNVTWWHEVARLYAAQADASPLVEACLASNPPTLQALVLAVDCEEEALELRPDLRERLRLVTEEGLEDGNSERRSLAAWHKLARRLRDMTRLSDGVYIDSSPITAAEYQLFIDERRAKKEFRQPDHWDEYSFASGQSRKPILGIRKSDAEDFCRWLGETKARVWQYSLPTTGEIQSVRFSADPSPSCFLCDGPDAVPVLPIKRLQYRLTTASEIGPPSDGTRPTLSPPRAESRSSTISALNRARVLARRPGNVVDRALKLAGRAIAADVDVELPRDRAAARAVYASRDLDQARTLDRKFDIVRDPATGLDRALDRVLARDFDIARDFAIAFDLDIALEIALGRTLDLPGLGQYRALCAFYLNWFRLIQARSDGDLSDCKSLWTVRRRVTTTDQPSSRAGSQ